jgi:hypothetical protein
LRARCGLDGLILMRITVLPFALMVASALTGCAVTEVKYDQDKIRNTLIDLYTNQVIDNLILAANGMPFIQLDYTNATATVTVNQNGSIGGMQEVTTSRPINLAARTVAMMRGITSNWTYGVGGMNSNQIALTANPAINNDEIYDAYLEYLMMPGSLRISCNPPPEGVAHICRKWRGNYFWIPIEFRTEFLRLALLTTAQRGRRLLPVPDFYAVTMTGIEDTFASKFDRENGVMKLVIKLDKKIPNDTGHIDFDVKDNHLSYLVERYATRTKDPRESETPYMTDKIVLNFDTKQWPDLKSFDEFQALLKSPVEAKLYLDHSRPDAPHTEDLLQNVRFQLEQIRFNQLR